MTPPELKRDLYDFRTAPVEFCEKILGARFTPDIVRMLESVRDNVYTLAKSGNAVGKSHGAAHAASWFYKTRPNARVYVTAAPPEENIRNILWAEIDGIIGRNKAIFEFDKQTDLMIARNKQSFITGVTIPLTGSSKQREARFSGKHAPSLMFIVDEGDAVPFEVYRGIESCISGGIEVRVLVLFNPRDASGPVHNKERDHEAAVVEISALTHPNVITGDAALFPGAVTRERTVQRINRWSRALVAAELDERGLPIKSEDCFEVPEFLVGYIAKRDNGAPFPPLPPGWRIVTDSALWYMVLAQYPKQAENQLISHADIERARSNYDLFMAANIARGLPPETPPFGIRPKHGLDAAELGGDLNASVMRYGDFVQMPETWNGVNIPETERRAAERHKRFRAESTFVDATGLGAGIPAHLEEDHDVQAYGVKVAESPDYVVEEGEFEQLRDQLWWSLRLFLKRPGAMLPPSERLLEAMKVVKYGFTKKRKIKVTDKDTLTTLLGYSPDEAEALMFTFYGEMVQDDEGALRAALGDRGR